MKLLTIHVLAQAAVLATAAGHMAAGQGAATMPASAAAARSPRTKAEKPRDDEAIPKALIDAARRSFVIVKFHFQKDTSETPAAAESDYRIARLYEEYVDKKRAAEAPGIVLDAKGHVLVVDGGLEDRFIKDIEIEVGGKTYPARRAKLLFDAPGTILQADPKALGKLQPVRFSKLADEGVDTTLLQAALYKADEQWRLSFTPLRPSVRLDPSGGSNVFFGHRSPLQYGSPFAGRYATATTSYAMGLIADAKGSPVGCALTSFIDLQQAECLWKGPDLLDAEGIAWEKLTQAEKSCRARLIQAVHEVVLVLRQNGEEETSYRYRSSSGAAGREVSTYGLATGANEIVVLQPIDSKMARQIEKVYVKHSATRREDVEFVGAYRDIGGFVVRLTGGRLPAAVALAAADPQRMRPFWMARLRKRHGSRYVDLSTNRLYGKARGYKGEYNWYAARMIPPGTFLVDLAGRLVGAYVHERTEHEEESRLEASGSYRRSSLSYRVFAVSELRELLTAPAGHVDPKITVRPRTLARRRAWLGVEFVPVTSHLAEMLKLETPTKDGQLGFLINAVYAGSPAEKMKLNVGDILLTLQAPGMPYPIELASRFASERHGYSSSWQSSYDDGDEDEGPVAPTWKGRRNFLTIAFDAIGVGKTVRLTYFRPAGEGKGRTVTADYKIQLAPPDLESAAKWKNRKLGLTVKDVTYEVRHALNLKDPAGVIVAKVESGSPTIIARIFPNEIITRLDDKPLASARQMRDLIAAAGKAGRDKVRLTVLRLGKTRFADLAIGEYDPADDEGIDEGE